MTKRALIVIAILILIPIIVVADAISKFKDKNVVVAEYGGNIDVIEYDSLTLRRVPGDDEYNFRFGEYLGKVGDPLTGASLYRVADDKTEKYYAIADGTKRILYTRSGKLADGVRKDNSEITRIVFDNYFIEETDKEKIALLAALGGKKVSLDMSEYKNFRYYDLYLSFDGSAILTEYYGRLFYLTDRELWLFVTPEDRETAEEEFGDEIEETSYVAHLISDEESTELLDSYISGN
ncbi:MAG: hypothetical protein IIX18_00055 [Clostridia bacterium]|nr:hypothetical protein [Clostridia bacterium]